MDQGDPVTMTQKIYSNVMREDLKNHILPKQCKITNMHVPIFIDKILRQEEILYNTHKCFTTKFHHIHRSVRKLNFVLLIKHRQTDGRTDRQTTEGR